MVFVILLFELAPPPAKPTPAAATFAEMATAIERLSIVDVDEAANATEPAVTVAPKM